MLWYCGDCGALFAAPEIRRDRASGRPGALLRLCPRCGNASPDDRGAPCPGCGAASKAGPDGEGILCADCRGTLMDKLRAFAGALSAAELDALDHLSEGCSWHDWRVWLRAGREK